MGDGGHLGQVVVALLVLGQKDHLVAVVFAAAVGVVLANKKFATDDGCYFGLGHKAFLCFSFGIGCFDRLVFLLHGRNKMKGPHHIGVVGQGDGWHLVFRSGVGPGPWGSWWIAESKTGCGCAGGQSGAR